MLSCFPDLDNGETKKKNNRKRLSSICFLKNCIILNLVPFSESNLISVLSVFIEIYMGKTVGIKVTNDQIHIFQRLFRVKSRPCTMCSNKAHNQNIKDGATHARVGESFTPNSAPLEGCTEAHSHTCLVFYFNFHLSVGKDVKTNLLERLLIYWRWTLRPEMALPGLVVTTG